MIRIAIYAATLRDATHTLLEIAQQLEDNGTPVTVRSTWGFTTVHVGHTARIVTASPRSNNSRGTTYDIVVAEHQPISTDVAIANTHGETLTRTQLLARLTT